MLVSISIVLLASLIQSGSSADTTTTLRGADEERKFSYEELRGLLGGNERRMKKKKKKAKAIAATETSAAGACLEQLGGTLDVDQLRWAFTNYSLAELQQNGWNFEGVPDPDFISETRFWSEFCPADNAACKAACPEEQVLIAGPAEGAIYDEFSSVIFTGTNPPGETFRFQGGGVLNPYYTLPSDANLPNDQVASEVILRFIRDNTAALGLFDRETFEAANTPTPTLAELPIAGSPFSTVVVAYPIAPRDFSAETCVEALGGLTIPQLRWTFTNYALSELVATGWEFTAVPNADLISETRFWSELCGDASCADACPAVQPRIAGPGPGTEIFATFSDQVFTGEAAGGAPETFRESNPAQQTDKIIDPYFEGATLDEVTEYVKDNTQALGLVDAGELASDSALEEAMTPLVGDVEVVYRTAMGGSAAGACLHQLGGALDVDQLRWAFTHYSLAEMNQNGWNFEGVPDPDFISETRFWSEFCPADNAACKAACPVEQVLVAGPPDGPIFDEFSQIVFTGTNPPGETFRFQGGGVKVPYYTIPNDANLPNGQVPSELILKFVRDNTAAIGLFDRATFEAANVGATTLVEFPVVNSPFSSDLVLAYAVDPPEFSAETCVDALGGLTVPQLRWTFSNYSLAELVASGWEFTAVPNADLISETRFWSELCGDASCAAACPAIQPRIAGPAPNTPVFDLFAFQVFTGPFSGGPPESVRQEDPGQTTDKIIDPYIEGSLDDVIAYVEANTQGLGLVDPATLAANPTVKGTETGLFGDIEVVRTFKP